MESAYTVLEFDGIALGLRQDNVAALESSLDVDFGATSQGVRGTFNHGGQPVEVFCLDANLLLMDWTPEDRRVCVILRTGERFYGLLVDKATSLNSISVMLQSMPPCMLTTDSPITEVAVHDGAIICFANAEFLNDRIEQLNQTVAEAIL